MIQVFAVWVIDGDVRLFSMYIVDSTYIFAVFAMYMPMTSIDNALPLENLLLLPIKTHVLPLFLPYFLTSSSFF